MDGRGISRLVEPPTSTRYLMQDGMMAATVAIASNAPPSPFDASDTRALAGRNQFDSIAGVMAEPPATLPTQHGASADALAGYVELFGYHALSAGWFFAGWMTLPTVPEETARAPVAHFTGGPLSDHPTSLFFSRSDLGEEAVGFLLYLPAPKPALGEFRCLTVLIDGRERNIYLARPDTPLNGMPLSKLLPRIRFIISLAGETEQRRKMDLLLDGTPELSGYGCIEFFGQHDLAGGWLVSGWLSRPWPQSQVPGTVLMSFEEDDFCGSVITTFFERADVPEGSAGVLFYVQAPPTSFGRLHGISLRAGDIRTTLLSVQAAQQLREPELVARIKSNLAQARPDLARDRLTNLITRRPYIGDDTLESLSPNVFLYIDEAIRCGAHGLALAGWLMAKPEEIRQLRLRSGSRSTVLDMDTTIKIDRQDVLQGFLQHGFDDPACGFIAYLPDALEPDCKLYIEVETPRCEIAYRNVERPSRTGMSAIKHLLGLVDVRFGEMQPAFEQVLGPAVEALNVVRLQTRPDPQVVDYGTLPAKPKFSVIVPLYGRMDFVEYQLALFSVRSEYKDVEFIYVLDDPSRRREAQLLFASVYQRFLIPFRVILLNHNVGFAPANNVGLSYARGMFIAYLNSDVFPGTLDWLEQLSDRLIENSSIGAVGPLLLFEDGSVQHRGMYFERLAEFGNWYFCQHLDKGLRYSGSTCRVS